MTVRERREWIGPGGPRGLQILPSGAKTIRGGFDSHTFPPLSRLGKNLFSPAALFLFAVFLSLNPLFTAEVKGAGPADEPTPSPFWSCIRSAVVPGWGQIHNGSPLRGAMIFSAQAYFLTRFAAAEKRSSYYRDRMVDPSAAWDAAYLQEKYDDRRGIRNDMVWWMTIFGLYSLIDAYVDASMAGFDREIADVERVTFGTGETPGGDHVVTVTVAW